MIEFLRLLQRQRVGSRIFQNFGRIPICLSGGCEHMGFFKKFGTFTVSFMLLQTTAAWAQGKGGGKSLESSKSVKYKSKTEVNFDDANIDGTVRTPFGTSFNTRDQKFGRNFVNVRKNFHDQMLLSTGGIAP